MSYCAGEWGVDRKRIGVAAATPDGERLTWAQCALLVEQDAECSSVAYSNARFTAAAGESEEPLGLCRCVRKGAECKLQSSLQDYSVYARNDDCGGGGPAPPGPTPAPEPEPPVDCDSPDGRAAIASSQAELAQVLAEVEAARVIIADLKAQLAHVSGTSGSTEGDSDSDGPGVSAASTPSGPSSLDDIDVEGLWLHVQDLRAPR